MGKTHNESLENALSEITKLTASMKPGMEKAMNAMNPENHVNPELGKKILNKTVIRHLKGGKIMIEFENEVASKKWFDRQKENK